MRSDSRDGAEHGAHDDTVAQKPPDTRVGTPLNPPAHRADLDQVAARNPIG